jgi:hypothetical protein
MVKRIFRMKNIFFFCFVFLFSSFLKPQIQLPVAGKTVITSKEISNSGIFRTNNIFDLMNEWDKVTTDGYHWNVSANGLNSFQKQNWILFLDGQKIDINFLGTKNINALPFLMSHIDSVEVFSSPVIINGEFGSEGLIHIHSLKPKPGFSLYVRAATGNITGDPGPYAFTEFRSDNIEEDGPQFSIAVDYGSDLLFGRLLLFTDTFAASDAAIRERNSSIPWDSLKIGRFMPSLEIGTNSFNGSHRLFLGYSTSEQQSFYPSSYESNDFLFIPETMQDYSVHSVLKHAGLNGNFYFTSHQGLNYQLKLSENKIYNTHIFGNEGIDQLSKNYLVNAEYYYYRFKLGASYERTKLKANYFPFSKAINLLKTYSGFNWNVNRQIFQNLDLFYVNGESASGIKVVLYNNWEPNQEISLSVNLGYVETIPDEIHDTWFFISNGFDYLNKFNVNYSFEDQINNDKKITADLEVNFKPAKKIQYTLGIIYRNFITEKLKFISAEYVSEENKFNTYPNFKTDVSGEIAGISFSTKHRINKKISHEIYYRFQKVMSGDDIFNSEWKTVPEHKVVYSISFEPVKSFSIWSRAVFLSSTYWNGFVGLDELSDGLYNEEIKSSLLIDISLRKTFWQNKIRLSLLFKNVMNNKIRFHPVSPMFPLSFYLQAELALNSFYEF